jgi:hypothetical protein
MNLFTKLRSALLGKRNAPVTRLPAADHGAMRVDELPPFNLHVADLMRFDPQVRIGLGARNGLLMAAEIEVAGPDPRLTRWVQHQWDALWCAHAQQLLKAKLYGFMPFEVVYRRAAGGDFAGLIEVDRLIDFPPRDVRLLVQDDQIVGFTVDSRFRLPGGTSIGDSLAPRESSSRPADGSYHDLFAPAALVATFDSECANPYGCALLARAYPPWFEKWMPGGAKRTLRLRMIKDAYVGDIIWYPPDRQVELDDGRTVSWREIAREIVEARLSGGALTLPLLYDSAGNKLVDYTPPQHVPGATLIFNWKRDLDLEIWKALEVPPEIIQASSSGSGYSGRWIPFAVALSAVHAELAELIRCVDRDLLRPLAHLNFGRTPQYTIKPRSLVETYAQMFGAENRTPSRSFNPQDAANDQ